ncbi:MAG: diguanylate cyclase domain-containing protein [Acidiferrobacterales bacterium]
MSAAAKDTATLHESLREAISRLLDTVEPPENLLPHVDGLRERLTLDLPADELTRVLQNTVDLVGEVWQELHQERQEWYDFLQQLSERFQELDKALQSTGQQTMAAYYGGRKAETDMERQVGDIESRLYRSSNVEQTKSYIHQRVATIRARLEHSQGKGAQVFASLQTQLTKVTTKIREVEKESKRLRQRYEQGKVELLVDPVTGSVSRLAYDQRLEQEIKRSNRYGSPMNVQLWRVDAFKDLSAEYGQQIADKVIRLLAKLFQANLREVDFVARYDGDKFAILLPETGLDGAHWVVNRLCRVIGKSGFHHRGERLSVTVSCGYSTVQKADTVETVTKRVCPALDEATAEGGGRYCAR